jgi:hypothetical protein
MKHKMKDEVAELTELSVLTLERVFPRDKDYNDADLYVVYNSLKGYDLRQSTQQ